MNCVFCGDETQIEGKVNRNDTCIHCGRDLRCCKQCQFYDTTSYNDCREVMAERVIDKERSNFCDCFIPRGSTDKKIDKTREAKKALEALFKK